MKRKSFKELRTFIRKMHNAYDNMNYGGCCVFAGLVAPHIEKMHPSTRVRVIEFGAECEDTNIDDSRTDGKYGLNTMSDWCDGGISFYHVVIEFDYRGKTYLLDSEGIVDAEDYYDQTGLSPYGGNMTIKETQYIARSKRGWNDMFNRDNIPSLTKDVNKFFNEVA